MKVDLDWLKKKLALSHKEKLLLIDIPSKKISISHQVELLGISRSSVYYEPVMDEYDLLLKHLIDKQYTLTPFYGSRKMTEQLRRDEHMVNRKHIQRLMREMGLVAIMDWWSRYVLSWKTSITLDTAICLEALEMALEFGKPEIFNTDQGSQFTSNAFTKMVMDKGIDISMDGRGRCMDNIFTERLWRSLKYENVYLMHYETVPEGRQGIHTYFGFYNDDRLHQSLKYRTPAEVYFQRAS